MAGTLRESDDTDAIPITPVGAGALEGWVKRARKAERQWIETTRFRAKSGEICRLPDKDGRLARVLLGVDAEEDDLWPYAALPAALPEGAYRIDADLGPEAAERAVLGWLLGTYSFTRYRKTSTTFPELVPPPAANVKAASALAEGIGLTRDLITTPASDMGPEELAEAARGLARRHRARFSVIVGDELLARNYPAVHAVGRASTRAPRLIDMKWGRRGPKVTLVGKGVCFDTGGLDLKNAAGMQLMKKDMGGSAHVLGLASVIMALKLPVRLRVIVPAVENAVAGNAMRPLDVLATRKGLTVEVGNTDAEGRLILADALTEAVSDVPDLLIDYATLTGAARVALGTEVPAFFTADDALAENLARHAKATRDPVWRLPLHAPYRRELDSRVADLSNVSGSGYGGAIAAALFLAEFVGSGTPWVHFDLMAWNLRTRPGRPEGGEAQAFRAVLSLISELAGL